MRKLEFKFGLFFFLLISLVQQSASQVVISQVYGGAGCGTAGCSTYKNDFIELFNKSASPVSLNGWSVQYAAATGTTWQVTALTNVTLQPGQYYLVAESFGTNGVNTLPTADATGSIAMSATVGKVALVNTTTALSGACPAGASIIDFVGYGTTANCSETALAPAPGTTTADIRAGGGCTDNNNNSTDFATGAPNPRNTSTAFNVCGGATVSVAAGTNGAEPATNGTFTVILSSAAPAGGITVTYSFTGSATQNTDYTDPQSGSVTIAQGNTSTTITLNVNDDPDFEGTETINITLNTATSPYTIATGTASISLTDNDTPPVVNVTAGINAAEPATNGTFNISLSSPAPVGGVTVTYTLGGSAALNTDYTDALAGSITIPEGNSSGTITLTTVDDPDYEGTETINITLNTVSSPYVINTGAASINLLDNEIAPGILLTTTYSQNFNSLANTGTGLTWTDNSTIPGWYSSRTTYNAGTGSSGTGALYSFGLTSDPDRSLGSVGSSGTGTIYYGARFKNNTGTTITALKITYTGEQWRNGGNLSAQTVNFAYQTAAGPIISLTAGTWTAVSNLNFTSPVTGASATALNGNTNSVNIIYSITGLSIPANDEIMIRWEDIDHPGFDHGLGIDDFTIEANPTDPFPPVITNLFPANTAANVPTNFTASITFDETVLKGSGNIYLKKLSDNSLIQTFDVNSAAVTIAATKVSFSISGLDMNTSYYLEMDNGAFHDQSGNNFGGFNGSSTWSFTTGTIFFLADFQNCTSSLSDGFTQYSQVGSIVWDCTTFGRDPAAPSGTTAFPAGVQINGFSGGTNVPNTDWLISPSLNLTGTTYPLLAFWSRTAFNGLPLQLKVSTDYTGGDPAAATWVDLNGKFPGQASNKWTVSENINLSAFKQSNVHIAFVYYSSDDDGARWTLDDISIDNSPVPPPPSLTLGTRDIQFSFVPGGSSADKTFTFVANDITGDVTLNSNGAFLISKDGSGFSSAIQYTVAEANNINTTVHIRFAPTQDDQNFTGFVAISTSDLKDTVKLKGTSIDPATTLEVVNWNMEWFGSTSLGPANNDLQEQNAETVLTTIGADIYGLVEVVDEARLANIVSHMPGYSYVICNYGSHTNPFESGASPLSEAQKEAFVYKTALFSNISTTALVTNGVNTAADLTNPAYNYFSSGRYPFMLTADVTLNGITKKTRFVLLHAKANTSPTATSYARRKAGSDTLKYTLNNSYPGDNIIILGDINDDLDSTITDGIHPRITSYYAFTHDSVTTYSSPTLTELSLTGKKSTVSYNDVIDHVILSNEMKPYFMTGTANVLTDIASLIDKYGTTTSDHYPVFTRYQFCKLTCPEPITVSNDADQCGAVVNFNIASSFICGTVTAVPASGSFFPTGTTTVNVTAGTGETCSFTVTVNDTQKPTITAPANKTVNNDAGVCYATGVSLGDATTSDNCPGELIVSNDAPAQFPKGSTIVTWTVTDAAGNTNTATQTITVNDAEKPTITAPANVTVSTNAGVCYATGVSLGNATTSDNCPGTLTVNNNAPAQFPKGTTIVTWTITDAAGNTNAATQTVTVNDTEKPVITVCPTVSPLCYSVSGSYTIPALTATDNCTTISYGYIITGATSRSGSTNNASGTFNPGSSIITWTVTDAAGNTQTCQTTVVVNNNLTVSIPDAFALSSGTLANTVYIGYSPASSLTLNAVASGGNPGYTYLWSTGATTSSITVSPTVNTTYSVTIKDQYNCQATISKLVTVKDIRGGKKLEKVNVCHSQSGSSFTVTVSPSEVPTHLSHGDMLGACGTTSGIITSALKEEGAISNLNLSALPNPSASDFTIRVNGGLTNEKVHLRVTDIFGRTIEQKVLQSNQVIKLGERYRAGIYLVEVFQKKDRAVLKLVKLND